MHAPAHGHNARLGATPLNSLRRGFVHMVRKWLNPRGVDVAHVLALLLPRHPALPAPPGPAGPGSYPSGSRRCTGV